jgi:hypothetical protein
MPTITSGRLEGLADTNPEMYEILRDFQSQLNQILPSIISGTGHPEITSSDPSPVQAGISAPPGTLYIQRNASSGPLAIHVKDTGFDSSGWSELGAFGSIPPTAGGGFQAVATTNSITFYYDGTHGSQVITLYRANGSSTQIPASSTVVNNLSPSTTYYFYPYYDERSSSLQWVAGTVGNVAIAFTAPNSAAAQTARLAHHIPLTPGTFIQVTTPSGGSSPTPVGGGFGGTGRYA